MIMRISPVMPAPMFGTASAQPSNDDADIPFEPLVREFKVPEADPLTHPREFLFDLASQVQNNYMAPYVAHGQVIFNFDNTDVTLLEFDADEQKPIEFNFPTQANVGNVLYYSKPSNQALSSPDVQLSDGRRVTFTNTLYTNTFAGPQVDGPFMIIESPKPEADRANQAVTILKLPAEWGIFDVNKSPDSFLGLAGRVLGLAIKRPTQDDMWYSGSRSTADRIVTEFYEALQAQMDA